MMSPNTHELEASPMSPATEGSPCTSQGIFGKMIRKLSLKRKSSKSSLGRKSSSSLLESGGSGGGGGGSGGGGGGNNSGDGYGGGKYYNSYNGNSCGGGGDGGVGSNTEGLNMNRFFTEVGDRLARLHSHTFFNVENEKLYRGVLRSLLHQVGRTEQRTGMRPGDLTDHIRQVFEVDQEDHEYFLQDELRNTPKQIQANINVIEASDLKQASSRHSGEGSGWAEGAIYCLLTLTPSQKKASSSSSWSRTSPRASPKGGSPRTSPHCSPKSYRKRNSGREPSIQVAPRPVSPPTCREWSGEVFRTQPSKCSGNPKWHELFQLEVEDAQTDDLHIYLSAYDDGTSAADIGGASSRGHSEKTRALKGFFRSILQTSDHEKCIPGCFGRAVLPLRDISSQGCDEWVDVFPLSAGSRSRPVGSCHLQATLSYKQDSLYEGHFCPEDYHQLALLVYKHDSKGRESLDSTLSPQSRRCLDIFAAINGISKLSQTIMELTVAVEMARTDGRGEGGGVGSGGTTLRSAVEQVHLAWASQHGHNLDSMQGLPLSDAEICLYRSTVRAFISHLLDQLHTLQPLFPPSTQAFTELKQRFSIVQQLLELDVWEGTCSPKDDLSTALREKLKTDITQWLEAQLSAGGGQHTLDSVLPRVEAMAGMLKQVTSHCTPLGVVDQFYLGLGVQYYRAVAFHTERQLGVVARSLMQEMDKYQKRYHSFRENIHTSSKRSLALFFAIRDYLTSLRHHLADRDMFRLTMAQYQSWFQESLVYWLQTFRTQCVARMEKALEIDTDLVVVTSLVKYSNSSVDVLSSFAKITDEWRVIDFEDPDCAIMGVTKITDLICDGARLYADKVHSNLERNCYYHPDQSHFDVTERLCITLNNIEHVRQYLNKLPALLAWDALVLKLAERHESPRVGKAACATLQRLVSSAHADILLKSSLLLRDIADKMKAELLRPMQEFLVKNPERYTSTDWCIGYLDNNLSTLHQRLFSSIYPCMLKELWAVVLSVFSSTLLTGKRPEYYQRIGKHLRDLSSFFAARGLEEEGEKTPLLTELRTRIELNSLPSDCLMLEYYNCLTAAVTTPMDYLGHLAVKTAYVEETRGKVSLFIKVICGQDLPGLDRSGLSDPYVKVSLQPDSLFPQHKAQKTRVLGQTVQPVFNTTFQFHNVAKEEMERKGVVAVLTIYDYDILRKDDIAGEVTLPLSSFSPLSLGRSVDDLPVVMMPLRIPDSPPPAAYLVLLERQGWDKVSRGWLKDRGRVMRVVNLATAFSGRSRRSGTNSFRTPLIWLRELFNCQ